jgi:hypothetical protein
MGFFFTHICQIGCFLETEEVFFSGTMELPAQHGHCFSFLSVTAVLLDCHGYKYCNFLLEQV